jgi:hypothetical protein
MRRYRSPAPANTNPANLKRRHWEAHDLMIYFGTMTNGTWSGL